MRSRAVSGLSFMRGVIRATRPPRVLRASVGLRGMPRPYAEPATSRAPVKNVSAGGR